MLKWHLAAERKAKREKKEKASGWGVWWGY